MFMEHRCWHPGPLYGLRMKSSSQWSWLNCVVYLWPLCSSLLRQYHAFVRVCQSLWSHCVECVITKDCLVGAGMKSQICQFVFCVLMKQGWEPVHNYFSGAPSKFRTGVVRGVTIGGAAGAVGAHRHIYVNLNSLNSQVALPKILMYTHIQRNNDTAKNSYR